MNIQRGDGIRARATVLWQGLSERLVVIPATARVMIGLFLVAVLLMAFYTAFSGKDASLELKVQHSLRNAQFSLWVDGDLAYSGSLVGSTKKKFGLIPSVQGSLLTTLAVTPGSHQIKVQIVSDGGTREESISGDFPRNGQRTLSVNAGRADLSLNWQPVPPASSASQGWLARYAGTLMLTVAGSIVSALTGFALRELPKQIASRQTEATKSSVT